MLVPLAQAGRSISDLKGRLSYEWVADPSRLTFKEFDSGMTRAFERPVVLPLPESQAKSGEVLEALYVPVPEPMGAALIAPPHPLMGGSMESPILTEMAWACEKAHVSSLRFNWRGVGASAGEKSGETSIADEDFGAGLDFLSESFSGSLVACGYSFGALAALRAGLSRPEIDRLILIAPPTSMLPVESLASFRGALFVATGDRDEWVDVDELRAELQKAPVSHLELLEDCDHFLMNGLGSLGQAISEWWGEPI